MVSPELNKAILYHEALAHDLFDALKTKTHDGIGIMRASYGPGEQIARVILADSGQILGLEIDDDPAGNVYMTLPGRVRSAAPVVIGSHLDSVAQGGNFDGAAGIISGLVACAGLIKAGGYAGPRCSCYGYPGGGKCLVWSLLYRQSISTWHTAKGYVRRS